MSRVRKWLRDHSLSVVLFGLFLGCLAAQSVSGFLSHNQTLTAHGRAPIGFMQYLGTGEFLSGVFSNWQAAILQLACIVVFGVSLRQKGAPHSRKLGERARDGAGQRRGRGTGSWVYRNSLSLAFWVLFALAFTGHLLSGLKDYNATRDLGGQQPVSAVSYLLSGAFWSKTAQTWQAEFFAFGLYVVLSVYLRQEGSSESKPTESSDEETGEANR